MAGSNKPSGSVFVAGRAVGPEGVCFRLGDARPDVDIASASSQQDKFVFMSRQITQWVDHVLGVGYHRYHAGQTWTPPINLYEDDSSYCIIVDLAGVQAEQIDVTLDEGVLSISGQRPVPGLGQIKGARRVHLMEIDHGTFVRRIRVPQDVDADAQHEANYKNGLLCIRLRKIT